VELSSLAPQRTKGGVVTWWGVGELRHLEYTSVHYQIPVSCDFSLVSTLSLPDGNLGDTQQCLGCFTKFHLHSRFPLNSACVGEE
jgi:hypothetical protein